MQGLPQGYGYPQQAIPQPYVPPSSDDGDLWTGVYVVAGGVAALSGLFAYFAIANAREHDALREEVEAVDARLLDYQQAHAYQHALIAQEQARVDGLLQDQISGLVDVVEYGSGRTVYGEPLGAASTQYPPARVSQVRPSLARSSYAPLSQHLSSLPTQSYPLASFATSMPQVPAQGSPVSVYVNAGPAASMSPLAVPSLASGPGSSGASSSKVPSHLELAITKAMARKHSPITLASPR